ncbi:PEP/pyruvate-binding domain-containing protein [Salinispira pacifica]|uniref:Phosphoenolpyruvate synthase / Pyruvate phosphate dikinase n=1 Tax=Salinispira pacifica TaxID=1307761 RepID=V5WL32_9SPIO|nr:PEP/pyruvate-binding domain-containing protein [Salinispira pacifica]AHC16264.1 Phosphoenolpyruvate synthase / Pyruvate phosphate dikinase [Salinispira pacifica]
MKFKDLSFYYRKFKFGEDNFHNLMRFRIRRILLVSTFYDAYIFEHDSLLSDQLVGEYHQLNLTSIPRMISVPGADDALRLLEKENFDIVITTMRSGETSCFELAERIRELYPNMPVVLLLTNKTEIPLIKDLITRPAPAPGSIVSSSGEEWKTWSGVFDEIFLWTGGPRVFLSIIKSVEDYYNVRNDIRQGLVRVLLFVDDSIEYSSIFLPMLYTELMEQIQALIAHEQNNHKKYLRMRTRPKILIARTYEEAMSIYRTFKKSMLGVISDVEFPVHGTTDEEAGFNLADEIRREDQYMPVLLQSMKGQWKTEAHRRDIPFICKKDPGIREELRHFLRFNLGFGDFIFRTEEETEIQRASNLKDFSRIIRDIPDESILYHARRNHFSTWLMAHGEFETGRKMRGKHASAFTSVEDIRSFLINSFISIRKNQNLGNIVDFSEEILDEPDVVVRIGKGSLGGKGRGLAFMNALLSTMDLASMYSNMEITVPRTLIIATDVFDDFLDLNGLSRTRLSGRSDEEIRMIFSTSRLPGEIEVQMETFLKHSVRPLAVRSSSLLEDSQAQPFSGVYETYMIPNASKSLSPRLDQLTLAIKLVYASVFLRQAVQYIENLHFNAEEEKMAIIIQEVAGERHGDYYYPQISGVGQSWNYYPVGPMKTDDKLCSLALGMGHEVAGGNRSFRFCPDWPAVPYHPLEDAVKYSQTKFYALKMDCDRETIMEGETRSLVKLSLRDAVKHRTLKHIAAVFDSTNNSLTDDLSHPGPKVVNFRGIIEYAAIPLAELLKDLMELLKKALGGHVEIEFAVVLPPGNRLGGDDASIPRPSRPAEQNLPESVQESFGAGPPRNIPRFYLLQVRPLNVQAGDGLPSDVPADRNRIVFYSNESLGNGRLPGIHDILVVDPSMWDQLKTEEIRGEISAFNEQMKAEDREYILIGPGRWGSRDKYLGVPVQWPEISKARILVELAVENYDIDPSQGSHFLHNLIAMNVGYAHISLKGPGFFRLDTLQNTPGVREMKSLLPEKSGYLRHFRSDNELGAALAGRSSESMVYLPHSGDS